MEQSNKSGILCMLSEVKPYIYLILSLILLVLFFVIMLPGM